MTDGGNSERDPFVEAILFAATIHPSRIEPQFDWSPQWGLSYTRSFCETKLYLTRTRRRVGARFNRAGEGFALVGRDSIPLFGTRRIVGPIGGIT